MKVWVPVRTPEPVHAATVCAETAFSVPFVNPAPASVVHLTPGDQHASDAGALSYYPLQSLMEDGKTIRLFFPTWSSAGFSDTIPSGWENVECFLFEHRGYLRRWGKGSQARQRQAEWMRDGGPAAGRMSSGRIGLATGCFATLFAGR